MREFTDRPVDRATVLALIRAATQAPSEVNHHPRVFAVIPDKELLKTYSDRAKSLFARNADPSSLIPKLKEMLADPAFNIFYNAGTLIVIYAKTIGEHPDWDCCLAGQNLMLAAQGRGLGTCVIGFAWPVLEQPEVKRDLNIPAECVPVLPIIVGYPSKPPPRVPRNDPEVLCWK